MGNFNAAALTLKGIGLLAKAQAGQTNIAFTRAVSGSGSYEPGEPLLEKEALKDQRQEFPFDKLSVENRTTVSVKFTITNEQESGNLQEGYHVKEIGIFAADPNEGEVLYAIATAVEDQWDYMPAYNSLMPSYITVEFYAEVSNASEVTIVSSGRFVTAEEMEAELEAIRELIAGFNSKFITAETAGVQHDTIIALIGELGELPEGVLTQADKGAKNGVASLDSSGKLSYEQLPEDSGALEITEISFASLTWKAIEDGSGWIGSGNAGGIYGKYYDEVKKIDTWREIFPIPDVEWLYHEYVESRADKVMCLYCKTNFKAYGMFADGDFRLKIFADNNLGNLDSVLKSLPLHLFILRTWKPPH